MRKGLAAALVTGSLLTGGAVGTAFFGPGTAIAQTSSSSDSQSSQTATPPAGARPDGPRREGMHHLDLSVAASTIGVTEDALRSALQSGLSIANVATANNVDSQTVIDALVADAQSHLAGDVASGKLTQAQADAISADLGAHVTDAVNHAGVGGPGGAGCPGMGDGDQPGAPPAPGSDSASSSTASGSGDS